MRKFLVWSSAILLSIQAWVVQAEDSLPLAPSAEGVVAPPFDLAASNGRRYRLSDYRGKPVILNFWATWCQPCIAELPSMRQAQPVLERAGAMLLAINVDDDPALVREFLAENPLNFPVLMDSEMRVAADYALEGVPTTLILDGSGRVAYRIAGEIDWADPALVQRIQGLN